MSIEGIRKRYLFREKWYIKGVGTQGGASLHKNLLSTTPGVFVVNNKIVIMQ